MGIGIGIIFSIADAAEIRYDKGNRRDPFVPLNARVAQSGKGDFAIEGIVFDPNQGSYAIIQEEIYREGESFNGSKIVRVLPDRVILLQEGKELVIWIREEIFEEAQKKGERK